MRAPVWRTAGGHVLVLAGPSLLLLGPLLFYRHFGGLPHFALHTLMGWDVGLLVLLGGRLAGVRPHRWDGVLPLLFAIWAMAPDFIYVLGPYHRDWMDVFLFHVALDEVLPYAVRLEALVWLLLVVSLVVLGRAWSVTAPAKMPRSQRSHS